MKRNRSTDQELIEAIRSGGESRIHALREIYNRRAARQRMIGYLINKGCDLEDAEDLFQDAFVIFDQNIRSNKFLGQSSIYNYLFGIIKRRWLNKYRSVQRHKSADLGQSAEADIDDSLNRYYELQGRKAVLEEVMSLLGERCRAILHLFSENYSMEEISKKIGINDGERVRKEKYRCLMRLRQKIQAQPALMQQLKNELNS